MISLTRFNVCFTPSLRMFILTCLAMGLFIRLGFWQLSRAYEKEQLIRASQQQAANASSVWHHNDSLPKPYQRLQVKGHFLPNTLFLDNQHHHHQFGYNVISPFMLVDGSIVLIDRGWIAGNHSRQQLPRIEIPTGELDILGRAYYPSSRQFVLGQVLEERSSNVAIVEWLDVHLISQFLHKSVYPFIIRQDKSQANGYLCEWPIVSMPPTRHYGYAIQWFAFALVVFVLFVVGSVDISFLDSKNVQK